MGRFSNWPYLRTINNLLMSALEAISSLNVMRCEWVIFWNILYEHTFYYRFFCLSKINLKNIAQEYENEANEKLKNQCTSHTHNIANHKI